MENSFIISVIAFLRGASVDFLLGLFVGVVFSCVVWFFVLRSRIKEYTKIMASKDMQYKTLLESKDVAHKSFVESKDLQYKTLLESKDVAHKSFVESKDLQYKTLLESKDKHYQTMLHHKDAIIAELHQKCDNLQLINKELVESTTKALYGVDIHDKASCKKA